MTPSSGHHLARLALDDERLLMITAVSPLELLHAFFACLHPFKGRNIQELFYILVLKAVTRYNRYTEVPRRRTLKVGTIEA